MKGRIKKQDIRRRERATAINNAFKTQKLLIQLYKQSETFKPQLNELQKMNEQILIYLTSYVLD